MPSRSEETETRPIAGRIGMKQTFAFLLLLGLLLSFWQWQNGRILRAEDRAAERETSDTSTGSEH